MTPEPVSWLCLLVGLWMLGLSASDRSADRWRAIGFALFGAVVILGSLPPRIHVTHHVHPTHVAAVPAEFWEMPGRLVRQRVTLASVGDPYGYGYVNQRAFNRGAPASSRWLTIMAYNDQCKDAGFSCGRLLRFSNPGQTYRGDAMGVPGTTRSSSVTGPSDARRRLNDTRTTAANFRVGLCPRSEPPTRISLQATSGHHLVAEGNGGGTVSANRPAVGPWETFLIGGGTKAGCLPSGDAVRILTSDGFYLRAEGGGGSTLDATATRAGAWELFVIHRVGGGTIRSGDSVALQAPSGHYVVAEKGGGSAVNVNRASIGPWETFAITVR